MKTNQHGVAVVLAMGVVALAAIAATAIMTTQSTWSHRSELAGNHAQARAFARGAVDWIRTILSDDLRLGNADHLGEIWALKLSPIPVENGAVAVSIDDQQGLFNVNNLVSAGKINLRELANFNRLLDILGLPAELASALVDWLDNDAVPQPDGAEDEYYLALSTPYLTANAPIVDLDELALVRGFDSDTRARLRPYLTALPRSTAVNVNTAPPEVIAAVMAMDLDSARTLVAKRDPVYFRSITDLGRALPDGYVVSGANISVNSSFFLASLRVTVSQSESRGTVLLARENGQWPAIVWRKYL